MKAKFRIFSLLVIFIPLSLFASKKTVCLNMIVKNESKVIERCLASVKPLIDHWVIVDTGSTDGTQEIIMEFMKDVPGSLHERPWVNFAHNRNEALDFAKGTADYVLIIDADEVLRHPENFAIPPLEHDGYYILTAYNGVQYDRLQIIKNDLEWRWIGVLHEYLHAPNLGEMVRVEGVTNYVRQDGARSQDKDKFKKDVEVLEKGLEAEPDNDRYLFYLAQSLRDAGELPRAIEMYKKRIPMGKWDQEVFWAKYQIGRMQQDLGLDPELFLKSYSDAFTYRQTRVEPLYHMANHYRKNKDFFLGYATTSFAKNIPISGDVLFVEAWMYEHGILLEHSLCAHGLNRHEEALDTSFAILAKPNVPEDVRTCVQNNLRWFYAKLFLDTGFLDQMSDEAK